MIISILGTRGIPACHGGFETFAEHLSLFLSNRGHKVTVYCQNPVKGPIHEDEWNGIRRVMVYGAASPVGTIRFDLASAIHACKEPGIVLTLGYNTAVFSILYRLLGKTSLMNMDGLEWRREKWTRMQRLWLRFNERAGAALSNHLIADHPEIGEYLSRFAPEGKISVIPYESEPVSSADSALLSPFGVSPGNYVLVVARPEPENSVLEIVEAFSRRRRGFKMVVLGCYYPEVRDYHRRVMEAAGPEVQFAGAIYDVDVVHALRFFTRAYIHGHRVGGTNPSLVESLAAGNPIFAHDNQFTRWVAGSEQQFFSGAQDLAAILDRVLNDEAELARMAAASRKRHRNYFAPENVLPVYEDLLERFEEQEVHVTSATAPGYD